jgi:hypothetical protein
MGLDTYAARTPADEELSEEDAKAFEGAELHLCGGLNSGHGDDGSFRGKVYGDTVEEVTGVSLYQEWIPPETVEKMADAFEQCDPEAVAREDASGPRAGEIRDLAKFFRICADRGLGLIGWY